MKRTCAFGMCGALAALILIGCSDNPDKTKQEALTRANAFVEAKKYPEAIIEYRRAIQIDPNFGEARKKLGATYLQTADYPNALRESVRAADLLPTDDEVQIRAGNLLLAAGKYEDAQGRADKVLARSPQSADAHVLRGNALAGLKNLDDALAEFETAAAAKPEQGEIHANIGFIQMAKGSKAEAEEAFRKATEVSPKSAIAHVSYANFLLAANDRAGAEAELKTALAVAPKDVTVHRALALLYVVTNRAADAEPHLRQIADLSTDPSARFALARFYFALNRRADALRELSVLASRKESHADATIEIATARYGEGQTAEAHKLLDDVLKESPSNARAHVAKAAFLAREHKWAETITAAKAAVERDPRLAEGFYVMGVAYQNQRDLENAKNAFSEVLKLQPNAPAAQVALAEVHLAMRDTNTAQQLATQAANRAPQALQVRVTLAKTQLANQNLEAAAATIKSLTADFPNREEPYLLEGTLRLIRKDYDAATRAFTHAAEISPSSVSALTGRISVLLATGRQKEARDTIERLNIFASNNADYLLLAARTYNTLRDFASAERSLHKLIEVDPTRSDAYGMLAQLYASQNKLDDALREYQNLAARQPKSVGAHTLIGTILQLRNQRPEAKAAYRTVLGITPGSPVAANNLAWMLAEDGEDLDTALQLAQGAKADMPDSADALDTLGFVYLKKGLPNQAVTELLDAVAKQPSNAEFKYRLGLAYAQSGSYTDARKTLESALALDAKSSQAEEARTTLAKLARVGS